RRPDRRVCRRHRAHGFAGGPFARPRARGQVGGRSRAARRASRGAAGAMRARRPLRRGVRGMTRALVLALALAAGWAVFDYLRGLNLSAPPVLAAARPAGGLAQPGRRAPARRVVWILVDGLRLDAARAMPTLARLAAAGRDFD